MVAGASGRGGAAPKWVLIVHREVVERASDALGHKNHLVRPMRKKITTAARRLAATAAEPAAVLIEAIEPRTRRSGASRSAELRLHGHAP